MAKRATKKNVNSNEMDGKEFFEAIHQIEQEKGIKPGYMMEKVTQALLSAIPIPDPRRERSRQLVTFHGEDLPPGGALREAGPDHFVLRSLGSGED